MRDISRTVREVSTDTGLQFSVYVGPVEEDPSEYAKGLLGAMPDSRNSVVIMVAPNVRRLEIVTGAGVRHRLTDRDCGLVSLSMTSAFAGGDLVGGITTGLRMLAD